MKRTLNWPPPMHRIAAKAAVLQGRSSVALLLGFTSAFTTTTTDIKCTTTLAAVACCCYCLCTQETSSSQSSVAKFWVQNASLLKQRSSSLFKTRGESRQEIIGVLFVSKNWKRRVRRCLFIRTKKCFRYTHTVLKVYFLSKTLYLSFRLPTHRSQTLF